MAETDQAPSTALASLPPARREILLLLKKRGEATAAELAGALGITVSGVRQQLAGLAADGWVAHRVERVPTGRPRHRHRLTP
ncbi:MAG: helix-turn-helix domain-containing protein, partial [Acidimicrobiales bacterium]